MTTTTTTEAEESTPGDSTAATEGDVYRLGHRWLIKGPIDVVFDLMSHTDNYPTWWAPCVKSTTSDDAEVAVGARAHVRMRGRLPYDMVLDVTLAQLERPHLLEVDTIIRLSGRFPMRGPVRYTFTEGPDGVEVINEQVIVAERRLPGPFRALARRAFAYNHAWTMKIGGRGLQKAVDDIVAARAAGTAITVAVA